MSNNKPKSSVTPVKQHLAANGKSNPNDVVAAARAAQEAKTASEAAAKPPVAPTVEEAKEPVATESDKPEESKAEAFKLEAEEDTKEEADTSEDSDKPKKPRKRLSRSEWVAILDKKEREGLTAAQIAEQHSVTEGNVYQWASKLKAEAEEEAKAEEAAKLSPSNIVHDAIELMKGITGELEAFDAKIAEAKALVDNAAKDRKVIEDSKKKYETIVELLGTEEDKAKLKEVEAELEAKDK